MAAASIIDWSLLGQRIGDRAVPLKPATLTRIQAGLNKYAVVPTLVPAGGTWNLDARPVTEPMRARTTRETEGLLVPVEGREGKQAQPAEVPLRTQTARHETALVVPYYGTGRAHPAEEPLHTLSTRDRFGVAFIASLRGGGCRDKVRGVDEALATVTASGNHHMLVRNNSSRGDGGEMCTPLHEPARTITTTGHQSVVGWERTPPAIEDCTFRMLAVPEISAAMAFTRGYLVRGNKREQVRQLGNAVTPPAAEWLIRSVVDSLGSAA
jgi:DNA (cytosine-5)-methyltransferase 1